MFKYCFTLGIVMVVFSIVYPMQKKHALALQKIQVEKESALFEIEFKNFKKLINDTESQQPKEFSNSSFSSDDRKLFEKFSTNVDSILTWKNLLDIKLTEIEFNRKKINELDSQISEFQKSTNTFKVLGWVFSIFGIIFWTIKTFREWPKTLNK